jgi:hypothetical protein
VYSQVLKITGGVNARVLYNNSGTPNRQEMGQTLFLEMSWLQMLANELAPDQSLGKQGSCKFIQI